MATVWIPKAAGHAFDGAIEHGTPRVIFPEETSPFNLDAARLLLRKVVDEVQPDDFVVMSGPTILCVLVVTALFTRLDRVKLLLFHARTGKYVLRELRKEQATSAAVQFIEDTVDGNRKE